MKLQFKMGYYKGDTLIVGCVGSLWRCFVGAFKYFLTASKFKEHQTPLQQDDLLKRAYEWWEYEISQDENKRLLKKYYPNEPTGSPRFFMDTDKLRIYLSENSNL